MKYLAGAAKVSSLLLGLAVGMSLSLPASGSDPIDMAQPDPQRRCFPAAGWEIYGGCKPWGFDVSIRYGTLTEGYCGLVQRDCEARFRVALETPDIVGSTVAVLTDACTSTGGVEQFLLVRCIDMNTGLKRDWFKLKLDCLKCGTGFP